MAKSVKQLQDEVLGYLDSIGENESAFRESVSIGIQKLLEDSGVNFILKVQENLNQAGKIDTGALSGELEISPIERTGDTFTLSIGYPQGSKASKYYDFVNKGVSGTRNKIDSPYSFRNERAGGMVNAINGWLSRNRLASRNETQRKGLSAVQRKRKKLSKMMSQADKQKSLAYAVSVSIKRKGLKKTGYIDKAIQFSFGRDFSQAVAKIIGREIVINIKQNGNNNR